MWEIVGGWWGGGLCSRINRHQIATPATDYLVSPSLLLVPAHANATLLHNVPFHSAPPLSSVPCQLPPARHFLCYRSHYHSRSLPLLPDYPMTSSRPRCHLLMTVPQVSASFVSIASHQRKCRYDSASRCSRQLAYAMFACVPPATPLPRLHRPAHLFEATQPPPQPRPSASC